MLKAFVALTECWCLTLSNVSPWILRAAPWTSPPGSPAVFAFSNASALKALCTLVGFSTPRARSPHPEFAGKHKQTDIKDKSKHVTDGFHAAKTSTWLFIFVFWRQICIKDWNLYSSKLFFLFKQHRLQPKIQRNLLILLKEAERERKTVKMHLKTPIKLSITKLGLVQVLLLASFQFFRLKSQIKEDLVR